MKSTSIFSWVWNRVWITPYKHFPLGCFFSLVFFGITAFLLWDSIGGRAAKYNPLRLPEFQQLQRIDGALVFNPFAIRGSRSGGASPAIELSVKGKSSEELGGVSIDSLVGFWRLFPSSLHGKSGSFYIDPDTGGVGYATVEGAPLVLYSYRQQQVERYRLVFICTSVINLAACLAYLSLCILANRKEGRRNQLQWGQDVKSAFVDSDQARP